MNIIFGQQNAELARQKYTVLELDTFQFPDDGPEVTAYCTIDKIKFDHMPVVESMSRLHHDLISQYGQKNWATCLDLINRLQGFWNGEVDSFYADLRKRAEGFLLNPPPENWTPVIQK